LITTNQAAIIVLFRVVRRDDDAILAQTRLLIDEVLPARRRGAQNMQRSSRPKDNNTKFIAGHLAGGQQNGGDNDAHRRGHVFHRLLDVTD
jgi:hypothetical protein